MSEIKTNNKAGDFGNVPLSDTELIAQCSAWISKLCESGGKAWTLRVPVDFRHDPDVLFTELIRRFKALTATCDSVPNGINEKVKAFQSELKALTEKYNLGIEQIDQYNGADEYCGTDCYLTVDGEIYYGGTVNEVLRDAMPNP